MLVAGDRVGEWIVDGPIGEGGMGEVYRADDLKLNQTVALKFVPPIFSTNDAWLTRLHNEVRIARQVTLAKKRRRHALSIQVIDNGPGIPHAIRDKVFYPLVSGREGGSGLGLTLVQNFVTQHHGTVTFETQPGGTTFTLLLPIQQNTTH